MFIYGFFIYVLFFCFSDVFIVVYLIMISVKFANALVKNLVFLITI